MTAEFDAEAGRLTWSVDGEAPVCQPVEELGSPARSAAARAFPSGGVEGELGGVERGVSAGREGTGGSPC